MFACRRCTKALQNQQNAAVQRNGHDTRNGDILESVGKFCYLGDMVNADGGADSAVVVRVRRAWKKFRELCLPH